MCRHRAIDGRTILSAPDYLVRSYGPNMTLNSHHSTTDGSPESGSLVIFTRVEGLLREGAPVAAAAAGDPLRFLASWGVPVVLVSAWDASKIRHLQHECVFRQPFICEKGAAVHIPGTWLSEPVVAGTRSEEETEWEVFRFASPSVDAAVHLLAGMFLARGYDPLLTVGIGSDLEDYNLLSAVDVPIVVRHRREGQPELLRQLPGVYVTSATGTAGWSEAVLGVRR